ncbi:flagellar protein FlaG [Brucepastera parasyntrophica]|uniref:flagellar protein FlaG n=1 Tax=Brucepastera parasyntrophica TaxID=2880008 RepID=UPI002108D2B3|nr:flagellar protein FlaG [Brucepastera parasyntrophica]ULQ59759.1 flagellar protein FlaG [Brucepastera parasyntrophica]
MSIEVANIGQHLAAMDRRLEGSVNSTLRAATETTQTTNDARSEQISEAQLRDAVAQIQNISDMFDRRLQFLVSTDLEKVIVKIIDSNTDKVIREIPSAEIQKLQARIKETLGLLFDETI